LDYNGTAKWHPPGTTDSFLYQPLVLPIHQEAEVRFNDFQVTGAKSFVTAQLDYFALRIRCRPVLDQINFSIPLTYGPGSWQFRNPGDSASVTLSTNVSDATSEGGADLGGTTPKAISLANLTVSIPTDGTPRTVTLVDAGLSSWSPGVDRRVRITAPHQTGCGAAKNESRPVPRDYGRIAEGAIMGMLEGNCDDGVLFLVARQSRPNSEPVAVFSMALFECLPDDRYGKAMLRMENAPYDNGVPQVIRVEETAPPGDDKAYGSNLVNPMCHW